MNYRKIIKRLAQQEQVSENEIEQEMTAALRLAGFNESPEDFIKTAALLCQEKTIYRRIV